MKIPIKLVLVLFIVSSCKQQQSAETKFNEDGVSFTVPEGWNISDQESLDDGGYYLSVEKDGLNSSGLVTITWLKNEIESSDFLQANIDQFQNTPLYQKSNLQFGEEYEGSFNGINTKSIDYSATIMTVKHTGKIDIFKEKGKTFGIVKQEASEDQNENADGFAEIERSLKVE